MTLFSHVYDRVKPFELQAGQYVPIPAAIAVPPPSATLHSVGECQSKTLEAGLVSSPSRDYSAEIWASAKAAEALFGVRC